MATIAHEILAQIEHFICSKTNNYTLVCVISKSFTGYEVGIADAGIKGYTPTGIKLEKERFDDAADLVDEANEALFPERDKLRNYKIELSSY